jgi:hypothetical protein
MKMLGLTSDDWGPFRDLQPVSDLGGSQSITIIVVGMNKCQGKDILMWCQQLKFLNKVVIEV